MFYYVYVLISEKDSKFYTGYSANLKGRLKTHNKGRVVATRNRKPLKLVYFEACLNREDALRREKYLKTTYGKRYIRNRLRNYLDGEKES